MNAKQIHGVGRSLIGMGMLAGLLLVCMPASEAKAAGVVVIGGSFGGHSHYHHDYVSGHYEQRVETVLVESAHYEDVWVDAEYKTILLKDGCKVTVKVAEG